MTSTMIQVSDKTTSATGAKSERRPSTVVRKNPNKPASPPEHTQTQQAAGQTQTASQTHAEPASVTTSAPATSAAKNDVKNDAKKSAAKNIPSHEIFLVETEGEKTTWKKVGVAFPTKSGTSHRVLVGERGSPQQKVYLVCPNSQFDHEHKGRPDEELKRIPCATIFDATGSSIDFKRKDGVAFLNRDESLSLLIGEKGDKNQQKLQMRAVRAVRARKTA